MVRSIPLKSLGSVKSPRVPQFEQTMSVVDECGLTFLHVFPYSPRPGTPAARMPQVPRPEVKRRAARLREKGAGILARWLASHQDTEMEFYVECNAVCRTAQFTEAHVSGLEGADPGSAVRARVVGHDGRRLLAEASA